MAKFVVACTVKCKADYKSRQGLIHLQLVLTLRVWPFVFSTQSGPDLSKSLFLAGLGRAVCIPWGHPQEGG